MKPAKTLFSTQPPFPTLGTRIFATVLDVLMVLVLYNIARRGYFGNWLKDIPLLYNGLIIGSLYQMSGYILISSTYAKVILGMRIVDETGCKMSLKQSFIRAVAVVLGALPIFLGYFYAVTNPKRQGFHDKVARTLVVFDES